MRDEKKTEWHLVAKTDEIESDEAKQVRVGDLVLAIYNVDGSYYATEDTCTHAFASLSEGWMEGDLIECPLHQARFHIPTGKAVEAPATEDVRTYPVKVVGDEIYVDAPKD